MYLNHKSSTILNRNIYPKTIIQSILLVILIVLLNLLFFALINYLTPIANREYSTYYSFISDTSVYLISFLIIHLICKRTFSSYNFKIENYKTIPLILLTAVLLDLGIGLPTYHIIPKSFVLEPNLASPLPSISLALGSLIIAPIFEELIMRGIILDGLLKNLRVETAILTSAILFTLIHFSFEKIPLLLLGGVFIGWIYYKTNSLAITILIHFLNNVISTYELYLLKDIRKGKEGIELIYGDYSVLLIIIFNIILFLLLYLISRSLKHI